MLWVFVILGALTLVAVLFGMLKSWAGRRSLVFIDLTSLVLVMTAWSLGHQSTIGRVALASAIALEVLAWMVGRDSQDAYDATDDPAMAVDANGEPVTFGEPVDESEFVEDGALGPDDLHAATSSTDDETQPMSHGSAASETLEASTIGLGAGARCVRTISLLTRPYHVTPDVFLASLKRSGLRSARLIRSAREQEPTYIEYESVRLGIDVVDAPYDREVVARALARNRATDALRIAGAKHAAHIAVDVAFDHQTPRATALRYIVAAHMALSEFAPVAALLLVEAAVALPAAELAESMRQLDDEARSIAELCVVNRSFQLDEENGGFDLLDTLGLTMFGLPDLQLILRGVATADEAALTRDALCEQVLREGCHLLHGTDLVDPRDIAWRVSYRRSAFDPDREVVQLIEQGRVETRVEDQDVPEDEAEEKVHSSEEHAEDSTVDNLTAEQSGHDASDDV